MLPSKTAQAPAATSWPQRRPPITEQLAKTYGLDSFGQIEAIYYTFKAEGPGNRSLSIMDLGWRPALTSNTWMDVISGQSLLFAP